MTCKTGKHTHSEIDASNGIVQQDGHTQYNQPANGLLWVYDTAICACWCFRAYISKAALGIKWAHSTQAKQGIQEYYSKCNRPPVTSVAHAKVPTCLPLSLCALNSCGKQPY